VLYAAFYYLSYGQLTDEGGRMDKLLSSKEMGEYLNLKQVTVRRKAAKGEIPATMIGRRFRFDKKEIDSWLHQNRPGRLLHILVIDDEPVIGQLFTDSLEKGNYQVTVTLSGLEAAELIANRHFDLIFLDLVMPELDGVEVFKRTREVDRYIPVVIITGYPDSDLMNRALEYGPFTVMKKPFTDSDITAVVNIILGVNQPRR
jgi:excisionase family DNA binding protein